MNADVVRFPATPQPDALPRIGSLTNGQRARLYCILVRLDTLRQAGKVNVTLDLFETILTTLGA